jgi:hypothetical protein
MRVQMGWNDHAPQRIIGCRGRGVRRDATAQAAAEAAAGVGDSLQQLCRAGLAGRRMMRTAARISDVD